MPWAGSLDAEKRAAKQQWRQRAVMGIIFVDGLGRRINLKLTSLGSALASLEAALHLVDHIDPALAADQTVVAVATAQRFQRVTDLHGSNPDVSKGRV
jgi:hypothetical protein